MDKRFVFESIISSAVPPWQWTRDILRFFYFLCDYINYRVVSNDYIQLYLYLLYWIGTSICFTPYGLGCYVIIWLSIIDNYTYRQCSMQSIKARWLFKLRPTHTYYFTSNHLYWIICIVLFQILMLIVIQVGELYMSILYSRRKRLIRYYILTASLI